MSDENEVYQKWLGTPEAERAEIEEQLCALVKKHAQAVVWNMLQENNPDLAQIIVAAVMTKPGAFRGENNSKFSTWVHAIAENKVNEELRNRTHYRAVFDEKVAVVSDPDEESDSHALEIVPAVSPDLVGPIAFAEFSDSLSHEDAALLRHKKEGLSSKEAAEKMGTTVEAIDSRWARLKPKLERKKLL
jgi:RNA polymerase sigma factor (sigma-70 family)